MPVLPPTTEAALTYAVADIVTDALIEIGVLSPGESTNNNADVVQWAFRKLNYLLDVWGAMRNKVYSYSFTLYTLVPGLSPHTIGPSAGATFSTGSTPRPVRLESAALILNAGSPVDLPMNVRDKDWWAAQQVKGIQTNVPTDVYYEASAPNGSLFFWPVPNSNQQVRLQLWTSVSQFASITDPIGGLGGPGTLPAAYRAALMLTLAETLVSGSNRQVNPLLAASALQARAALDGNNAKAPRIQTQDFGMPKGRGRRGDFSWATGGPPGGRPE